MPMDAIAMEVSGGCQCGAVRYHATAMLDNAHICHCRMCQKATGSVVWPFFTVRKDRFNWTRGEPAHFRSSAVAQRGFCAACGTPLTFAPIGAETIDVGIGTLDRPAELHPTAQYWIGARVPWFADMPTLPEAGLGAALPAEEVARRAPYQHPDHDTPEWHPREGA
jgi:hypothetical protein